MLTLVKHLNVFAEKVLLEKGVKVSAKSKKACLSSFESKA